MILVNQRPVNGVDLSHWNEDPLPEAFYGENGLEMMGHKACHIFDDDMVDGVDPKFHARRRFARSMEIRWRPFFEWILPANIASPATQVELLLRTVGDLDIGECVYLDWEDPLVTRPMIEDFCWLMDVEFPNRWFMYVNDQPGDMLTWMTTNKASFDPIPIMHPSYNLERGLGEARKWNATVWQVGTGQPPGFTGNVPMDYVMRKDVMDELCGR